MAAWEVGTGSAVSGEAALVSDDMDAAHCRKQAKRCRWLAERAGGSTAEILVEIAQEYEAKALELERAQARPGSPANLLYRKGGE